MREVYSATIVGSRPYLMHSFKGRNEEDPLKKKGANPTVAEDCEDALYRMSSSEIFVPSMQLEASMKNAATKFILSGRKTYKDAIVGGITVDPLEIPMQPQTFEPFVTGVRIGQARIMKGRPMFRDWSLTFKITSTDERIKPSTLKQILDEAGMYHGIGDWRPKFGLFTVKTWEKEP